VKAQQERRGVSLKLKIARAHLAGLEIDAHQWLRLHSKAAVVRGAVECSIGGWKELLFFLMSPDNHEIPSKCAICQNFLQVRGFSMDDFKKAVESGQLPMVDQGMNAQALPLQNVQEDPVDGDGGAPDEDMEALEGGPAQPALDMVNRDPYLELLEPGSHKCRLPVRCLVCVNKAGAHSIFDMQSTKRAKNVIQHVIGPMHVKNVRIAKNAADASKGFIKDEEVACCGFCPQRCQDTKVHAILDEFNLWSVYNGVKYSKQLKDPSRHAYILDMATNEHSIFHHSCLQVAAPDFQSSWDRGHPMCKMCKSLGNSRPLLRVVSRFFVKHSAARGLF